MKKANKSWEEEFDRKMPNAIQRYAPLKAFIRKVEREAKREMLEECVGLAEHWVYSYLRDILNVEHEMALKIIKEEAHVEGAGDGRVNGAIRVMAYLKSKLTDPQ